MNNGSIFFTVCYETKDIFLDEPCFCKEKNNAFCFKDGKCIYCNGSGFIPTEEGKAILDFLKRHKSDDPKKTEIKIEQ